ncbi:MAG: hypothetical protein OCC49_05455 [Fibrobacterales bacterium]
MKYPITILFLIVFASIIQGTILFGWLTHHLYFTIEKLGSLTILGLAVTGFTMAYLKILSASINGFWSIKIILATLLQFINFGVFLGFAYLLLLSWVDQPLYIGP